MPRRSKRTFRPFSNDYISTREDDLSLHPRDYRGERCRGRGCNADLSTSPQACVTPFPNVIPPPALSAAKDPLQFIGRTVRVRGGPSSCGSSASDACSGGTQASPPPPLSDRPAGGPARRRIFGGPLHRSERHHAPITPSIPFFQSIALLLLFGSDVLKPTAHVLINDFLQKRFGFSLKYEER